MRSKIPNIVTILVITLLTVIMWISIDVYLAFKNEVPPKIDPQTITALDPKLDLNMVNVITKKQESKTSGLVVVKSGNSSLSSSPIAIFSPTPVPTTNASPVPSQSSEFVPVSTETP